MKLITCFSLALNSITHRQLRSWLTLLGVVIGVAAVVAILTISTGAQASISNQLSNLGADIITISAGSSRGAAFGGDFRPPGGPSEMQGQSGGRKSNSTDTKKSELKKLDAQVIRANKNIIAVNEIVSARGDLVFLSEKSSVTITGVNPTTWKEITTDTLALGRFLSASDSTAVVIGDRIANDMFKQSITLGRTISIEGKAFTVVGVLDSVGSSFGGGSDNAVYMPYKSVWEISDDVNVDVFTSIQAKVSNAELVDSTTTELEVSLLSSRKVTEKTKDFTITSSQAMQEQISSVTNTLALFLGAIAAVSLLVGAIGVANSMFTSVLEKTRLIGILKALGATEKEVLTIFLIESGLFGLIGGVLGAVLGIICAMILSSFGIIELPMMRGPMGGEFYFDPVLFGTAIIISTLIGIISGFVPAKNASKLKPIEALRYE